MAHNYWIYLLVMFAMTYLVRVLPLVLVRSRISNTFIRSFLYYIPYAVLAAMTFPAVFYTAGNTAAAVGAVAVGIIVSLCGGNLVTVALSASAAVYVISLIL